MNKISLSRKIPAIIQSWNFIDDINFIIYKELHCPRQNTAGLKSRTHMPMKSCMNSFLFIKSICLYGQMDVYG